VASRPCEREKESTAEAARLGLNSHRARHFAGSAVAGALNRPGTVRVDKIYTLAQAIIVKKFGKVGSPIVQQIRQLLDKLTSP